MRHPNVPERAGADASGFGHGVRRPMPRLAWHIGERQRHHPLLHVRPERRNAGRPHPVAQQPSRPFAAKRSCQGHTQVLDLPVPPHDIDHADTSGAQQHDLDTLARQAFVAHCHPLWAPSDGHDRRNGEGYSCAMPKTRMRKSESRAGLLC